VALFDALGQITGVFGISRDITALKESEREREQLIADRCSEQYDKARRAGWYHPGHAAHAQ